MVTYALNSSTVICNIYLLHSMLPANANLLYHKSGVSISYCLEVAIHEILNRMAKLMSAITFTVGIEECTQLVYYSLKQELMKIKRLRYRGQYVITLFNTNELK